MLVKEERLKNMLVHYKSVRSFAQSLCHNPALADDLTQETYLKVQLYIDSYQEGTNPKAWLFAIVKNMYISLKRRSGNKNVSIDDVYEGILNRNYGANQLSQAEANLELKDLSKALECLPIDQKEAILLVCVDGFSYEDAAAVCVTEVGTIKSRVNRARIALQDILYGSFSEISSNYSKKNVESSADVLLELRKLQGSDESEENYDDVPTFLESY